MQKVKVMAELREITLQITEKTEVKEIDVNSQVFKTDGATGDGSRRQAQEEHVAGDQEKFEVQAQEKHVALIRYRVQVQ